MYKKLIVLVCVVIVPGWNAMAQVDYSVVDDFDSYVNTAGLLTVWTDGVTNGTGSAVFLETNPAYVRDGNSLKFTYNNTIWKGGKYIGSDIDAATAGLPIGSDWTVNDANALVLYFYGQAGNSADANDQMWVELEDTSSNFGHVIYDDMNDVKDPNWHIWYIDLVQGFGDQGVGLSNIANVYLGFGGYRTGQLGAGGVGTVYFDNIRLYPSRCLDKPLITEGNLNDDCIIDLKDFAVLADNWLKQGTIVP
jgi:hypothetical protein